MQSAAEMAGSPQGKRFIFTILFEKKNVLFNFLFCFYIIMEQKYLFLTPKNPQSVHMFFHARNWWKTSFMEPICPKMKFARNVIFDSVVVYFMISHDCRWAKLENLELFVYHFD